MGMTKFTGPDLSEDPEEEDTVTLLPDSKLFDITQVQNWAAHKKLKIISTAKENG